MKYKSLHHTSEWHDGQIVELHADDPQTVDRLKRGIIAVYTPVEETKPHDPREETKPARKIK